MIVRHLQEVAGSAAEVKAPTWSSLRLLLRRDGMGFSLHETVVQGGTETKMWYRHHLEAAYCIEGEGEIESLADGAHYAVTPGTVYALNEHERHILRAVTPMRLICIFNPPLSGSEVHDAEGGYPLVEE